MPISIPAQPFTFASESGNQPAAQLDSSFANIRNALTGVALQASDLIGGYGTRNLRGVNNAGTPNTKYDVSADLVVLRAPGGGLNVQTSTGVLTNDTGLAGPASGGRDQAGAFGASTWLHFYFIWNGATLSTVSSTVAPPTGPTLPGGYTHWAYIGAVRYNATPLLVPTTMTGPYASYWARQGAYNAVVAVETGVSVATVVPPNASMINLSMQMNSSGAAVGTAEVRFVTGQTYHIIAAGTAAVAGIDTAVLMIPNQSQNIFHIETGAPAASQAWVLGYLMPNGGA
jgi:hypothetical protein